MPRRPRAHQLEQESRDALRSKLTPLNWILEDFAEDYGLDGRVEIFTDEGVATGRAFYVQLKGTDKAVLEDALAIRIKTDTLAYYRSQAIPVLLVLYCASSRRLFGRWVHEFHSPAEPGDQVTLTLRMEADDEWEKTTPARLEADLEILSRVKGSSLPFPLDVSLKWDTGGRVGPRIELETAIRRLTDHEPRIVRVRTDIPNHAHIAIDVRQSELTVNMYGLSALSFRVSEPPSDPEQSWSAEDILLGLALGLDSLGHSHEAALLIVQYALESRLLEDLGVGFRTAVCLATAARLSDALLLAERLLDAGATLPAVQQFLLVGHFRMAPMTGEHEAFLAELYKRVIEREVACGDEGGAAVSCYNFANSNRSRANARVTLRHYRMAVRYDSNYLDRAYWWKEVAGVLFEARRYRLSAKFYARSLELGEKENVRALYADALMFSGRFADSEREFEKFLERAHLPDPEWQLKRAMLPTIMTAVGRGAQTRNSVRAHRLCEEGFHALANKRRAALEETDLDAAAEVSRSVIDLDALNAFGWLNRGVTESLRGNREGAGAAFLIAALLRPGDVESWCDAILLAMGTERLGAMLPWIISAAYSRNRESLTEKLYSSARAQPAGFDVDGFMKTVRRLLDELADRKRAQRIPPPRRLAEREVIDVILPKLARPETAEATKQTERISAETGTVGEPPPKA